MLDQPAPPATTAPPAASVLPSLRGAEATGRRESESAGGRLGLAQVVLPVLLGVPAAISLAGLPYYVLSEGQRVRHPWNAWLRPTGYIGQSAGIVAFALFAFLWLYPVRKRFRRLAFTGSIGRWLELHVLAGLGIPLLAALHASWRFTGLIGLGYGAMMVVCLSGMLGRYIYVRIPRSRGGLELTLEEVNAQRTALERRIAAGTGLSAGEVEKLLRVDPVVTRELGAGRTLLRMASDDLARWRAVRDLRRRWRGRDVEGLGVGRAALAEAIRVARREMALRQQVRMLDATQRVFRYWHAAHRPVAITALIAVGLHVATAIALGVTWLH